MTLEEFKLLAKATLEKHLLYSYWSGLAEGTQDAALTMASEDCISYLGWNLGEVTASTLHLDTVLNAVAEQAVFLTRHYEDGEGGRIVASESAGGVSQSYAIAKGVADGGIWSTRAKSLLDTVRKRCAGSLRIFRG